MVARLRNGSENSQREGRHSLSRGPGPDSAGADPGPACYGRGGAGATVTDADLLLGRIDPTGFSGGRMALAPRFSVSAFLPDIRRHSATYFPYSGKPLSFLVASDEHDDDADNPLRICYGNEGSFRIVKRFEFQRAGGS